MKGKTNMNELDSPASQAADRALVITRMFDAPRELVFKAWTEVWTVSPSTWDSDEED